jgi:hypothetical protein
MSRTGEGLETDCGQSGHHLIWTRPSRLSPPFLPPFSLNFSTPGGFTIRDRYIQRSAKRTHARTPASPADQGARGAIWRARRRPAGGVRYACSACSEVERRAADLDRRLLSLYVGQLLNNLAVRNSEDIDASNVALVGALLIEHVSPAHRATVTRGDEFLGFEVGVR